MFLDEKKVRALLRMEELIPAMADALRELSAGKVEQPMRLVLPVAEHQGFFGVMPACGGALGAKLVTFYPNNQGIPTHHAMILLFRPETGEPLVTMDGRLITEMRTAAVSAVATDHLARARCFRARDSRFRRAGPRAIWKRFGSCENFAKFGSGVRGTPGNLHGKFDVSAAASRGGSGARRRCDRRGNVCDYARPSG